MSIPMGVILAGGRSRRFGSVKAEAELCGMPLAEWVLRRMRPQVAEIIVSANGPLPSALCGQAAVPDVAPGFRGPLAGLLSGLEWIGRHRPDAAWCSSVPVDTPFLPMDLVARLQAESRADVRPAVAASGGHIHPATGLWPVALAPRLRRYLLEEGRNDVMGFVNAVGVRTVMFPDEPYDPFFNVNTPDDLERAEHLCHELDLTRDVQRP